MDSPELIQSRSEVDFSDETERFLSFVADKSLKYFLAKNEGLKAGDGSASYLASLIQSRFTHPSGFNNVANELSQIIQDLKQQQFESEKPSERMHAAAAIEGLRLLFPNNSAKILNKDK
jgi:hypothetical protein